MAYFPEFSTDLFPKESTSFLISDSVYHIEEIKVKEGHQFYLFREKKFTLCKMPLDLFTCLVLFSYRTKA